MPSDAPLALVRMDHAEAEKYGQIFAKGRACLVRDLPLDVVPFRLAAVVMAGHELGFSPFTSIAGISIVEGKPRLSYQLTAALIRRSGRYDYRAVEVSSEKASIEFLELDALAVDPKERWRSLGVSTFTIEDAQRADLAKKDVWKKYPKNMLWARALTQGTNMFCPDVAAGCPIYAEDDDLGGSEREVAGRVVQAAVQVAAQVQPAPKVRVDQVVAKTTLQQIAEGAAARPDPALSSAKAICAAAAANGAPASETVTVSQTAAAGGANLTATVPQTQSVILRPDGTTVPLDSASAAIENARQAEAPATATTARPARKPRKKKDEPAAPPPPTAVAAAIPENPKADVGFNDASLSRPAAPQPNPAKTEAGVLHDEQQKAEDRADAVAQAMGVQPGDGPLAPAAEPKPPEPAKPIHPGLAASNLQDELADLKLDGAKPVSGALASRAHTCGINSYGTDALARAAWQAVGYTLPKKGDKVQTLPTAQQVDGYLATVVQREEQKEKDAEPLSAETSDL